MLEPPAVIGLYAGKKAALRATRSAAFLWASHFARLRYNKGSFIFPEMRDQMAGFVSCAKHTTDLDATLVAANAYTDTKTSVPDATETVKGKVELATVPEALAGSDTVRAVTPAGLGAAIDANNATLIASIPVASTSVQGKVELATVAETTAGTDATRAVTPAGLAAVIAAAPVSTLTKNSAGLYVHKDELSVSTVIQPMDMVSTDAGQSLVSGSDGKIFVNVIGLLPPDSTYSGSNNGTVDITMVPDITDPTLITIEANLNVAGVTPTGNTNPLQWSASGFFVNEATMATNIVNNSTALTTLTGAVPVATETVQGKVELATAAEVITGTDTTRAVTVAGLVGRTATDTRTGLVELATTAEAAAGTSTGLAVTPAGVAAAITALAGAAVPDASLTVAGKVNLLDKQVLGSGSKVIDTVFTRAVTNVTALDMDAGDVFTRTVSGATTFSVTNVPVAGQSAAFILQLTNGGSAAITWWSGVKWTGGIAPTLTAAGVDILGFYTIDAGVTWRGLLLSKDSK